MATPGAKKERIRAQLGSRLASRILGRKLQLIQAGETWELVDPRTGEIVTGIGGRERFFPALLMRAAMPGNHLAGVLTHKPREDSPGPSWAAQRHGKQAFGWIPIG